MPEIWTFFGQFDCGFFIEFAGTGILFTLKKHPDPNPNPKPNINLTLDLSNMNFPFQALPCLHYRVLGSCHMCAADESRVRCVLPPQKLCIAMGSNVAPRQPTVCGRVLSFFFAHSCFLGACVCRRAAFLLQEGRPHPTTSTVPPPTHTS